MKSQSFHSKPSAAEGQREFCFGKEEPRRHPRKGAKESLPDPRGAEVPSAGKKCPPEGFDEKIRETLIRELKLKAPATEQSTPQAEPESDWLPARMLNEFVYCPRLFFYEHVEGVFVHNADTERGKDIHKRVDRGSGAMPGPSAEEAPETIHSRSVQMGSARYRITAKLDLVESREDGVAPVDYKAGAPREGGEIRELWPTDRMQLGLQMLILRENGYSCHRGFIYYRATKQRVALEWSDSLETWLVEQILQARALQQSGIRPPPLVDSPKCPRCSLVSICLPDETRFLQEGPPQETAVRPRRLIASRDDTRALYLNTHGLRVGIKDRTLDVREKDRSLEQIRLSDVHHVALFGNVQISTQAIHQLCEDEIPITYFTTGGWFYGITRGHSLSNILLRQAQFQAAADPDRCLAHARQFISGKIRNSRKMLMRNALEQPTPLLQRLKYAAREALEAASRESLLGIEGAAAAAYFSEFSSMIKPEEDDELPGLETPPAEAPVLTFDFARRNRRPPADPVNALLSFAYSLLAKDCTVALLSVGFDPWMGFYHQPRPGRPALALDLMEEFRPLIAESAVISAINNRMITPKDFVRAGQAVNLSTEGRKCFLYAYEQRMGHLITHPIFDYRVSYRRALELQARLLARSLEGEIPIYTPFMTR